MSGRRNTQTAWPALIAGAAVGAWGWRLEIALLVLVIAAARLLATVLGELPAVVVVGTLIAALLALAPAAAAAVAGVAVGVAAAGVAARGL